MVTVAQRGSQTIMMETESLVRTSSVGFWDSQRNGDRLEEQAERSMREEIGGARICTKQSLEDRVGWEMCLQWQAQQEKDWREQNKRQDEE